MEFLWKLFENNLINWFILVGLLVIGWNKITPAMFQSRKQRIETALSDAATARAQGEEFLREQQAKVANADKEAAGILEEARQLAVQLQAQMNEQTKKDIVDLQRKIEQQIESERRLAITELRGTAARTAIRLTEQILPSLMTAEAKSKLQIQFMEQLDSPNQQTLMMSAKNLESIH